MTTTKTSFDTVDDIDDFLDSLGLNSEVKPDTPEEMFYKYLCGSGVSGTYTKIFSTADWLRLELERHKFLENKKIKNYKKVFNVTLNKEELKELNIQELSIYLLEFYLLTYHAPRFLKIGERPPCDLQKTITLIMSHESVKRAIDKFS